MAYYLKNDSLEVRIDHPLEHYNFSRFDWTGKIASVKFRGIPVTINERPGDIHENLLGKGLYNEFGIEYAMGYEETEPGGWFHKIGVGLLKRDDSPYLFSKNYQIQPAQFEVFSESHKIRIGCRSHNENGYAYFLTKEILLQESNLILRYHLENKGVKPIETDEYTHNFIAVNGDFMGKNYLLRFPFQLSPALFDQQVNPEGKVNIGQSEVHLNGTPGEKFFFSNLSGGKLVEGKWELINRAHGIGIAEVASVPTEKINLWGWKHVISPEIYQPISIAPNESAEWTRTYLFFDNESTQ